MNIEKIKNKIFFLIEEMRGGVPPDIIKSAISRILENGIENIPLKPDESLAKEKNLIIQTAKQELNKLLIYVFNHLDNTQTKLMRSKDKDLQFNIGYNEGTYKTVKELKIVLEELWQEMTSNFIKKKNPQREENGLTPGGIVNVPAGFWSSGSFSSSSVSTGRPLDDNENAPF